MGASGSKIIQKTTEKAAKSQISEQAVKKGVKYFKEEADAMWEISKKASLPNQDTVIEKILQENKKDEIEFAKLFPKKENALERANRDLSDLYAPFADKVEAETRGRGGK
ncbi:MAG: hypothetical protein PQ612_01595 [Rickettsiales bacterium]|nr:hypothetical protein [Pseudomonadota bacterium]MDA0965390.1 hypothetical protein [Pseudomonadota bacterium]MDG4544318.1 hypothetical protein [Rickettsiales bacterium]MDG4544837.1 hypothetical protein [Rickettsiales bacterium]MDG4546959.1 hypothetical protein [Rickettsiales bacterium]